MPQTKKVTLPNDSAEKEGSKNAHIIAFLRKRVNVRFFRQIAEVAFHLLLSALGAVAVASWAIPAAYAERGYHAIGGEWLLVILTFIAIFYVCEVKDVSR